MRASLLAIVLAIGCRPKLPVEIGGIDFDYGFVVTYPDEGPPKRLTPVFGVEDGRVVFGETPALSLDDEEERFVFVAIKAEDLHPSFERARAADLDAILEPPPEDAMLRVEGVNLTDLVAKTRVPAAAQILTADLEEGSRDLRPIDQSDFFTLFEDVTLRIPVQPEHCRLPGQQPLVKFAATPVPIRLITIPGVENALYLDRDRAIVATRRYVYLVERDQTFTSTRTGPIWSVFADPDHLTYEGMFDLAIGPGDVDRRIVTVGGDTYVGENPRYARIWSLRLRDGVISMERPSVRIDFTDLSELYFAAAFTPDGTAWVGGPDGVLRTRTPEGTDFATVQATLMHRTDLADAIFELKPISSGGFTMMAGLKNHLYLLGPGGWEGEHIMRDGILGPEAIRWSALAAIEDENGSDFWAVGDRGQIARKSEIQGSLRDWDLLSIVKRELVYPPRFAPCASADPVTGELLFNRTITAIYAFEDHVFLGYQDCNALVVVRRSDQCVSLVAPDDKVDFSLSWVTSIDRLDRRLLIGYSGGELYETEIPQSAP